MVINSAQYQRDIENTKNVAIKATINGVVWSVPLDPANTDYQEIQKWVAKGNTIQEAE